MVRVSAFEQFELKLVTASKYPPSVTAGMGSDAALQTPPNTNKTGNTSTIYSSDYMVCGKHKLTVGPGQKVIQGKEEQ